MIMLLQSFELESIVGCLLCAAEHQCIETFCWAERKEKLLNQTKGLSFVRGLLSNSVIPARIRARFRARFMFFRSRRVLDGGNLNANFYEDFLRSTESLQKHKVQFKKDIERAQSEIKRIPLFMMDFDAAFLLLPLECHLGDRPTMLRLHRQTLEAFHCISLSESCDELPICNWDFVKCIINSDGKENFLLQCLE